MKDCLQYEVVYLMISLCSELYANIEFMAFKMETKWKPDLHSILACEMKHDIYDHDDSTSANAVAVDIATLIEVELHTTICVIRTVGFICLQQVCFA